MGKSQWRQEQETRMETFSIRMTAAHARKARQISGAGVAEGVRQVIERAITGREERRVGAPERRVKKKK
jgi:hypothetical protein